MKRLLLLPLLLAPALTQAATAYTDPVGAMVISIPAHSGGNSTLCMLNLSFLSPIDYAGTISAVSGNTVTDGSAVWLQDEFKELDSNGEGLFYIEFTTGTYSGLTVTISSNSSNVLTLDEDVSELAADVGLPLHYRIRRYITLEDAFSSDNSLYSFRSGGNANVSDVFYLLNSVGEFVRYYYQTAPAFAGGTGWRRAGDSVTNRAKTRIEFNSIMVSRNGSVPGPSIDIVSAGDVKTGDQLIPVYEGYNLIGYGYPLDTTLGSCGIDPNDLLKGGNANVSDVVYILNPQTGILERFYYQAAPAFAGGSGWRLAGDAVSDRSTKVISAGSSVLLLKRGSGSFYWGETQPF